METLDQLIKQRLTKLKVAQQGGFDPYLTPFERDGSVGEILSAFSEEKQVRAAGRLTALRAHGKTTFGDLKDQSGRIQLYFSQEILGERYDSLEELDLGDIVALTGTCFKTKTGEPTLRISHWSLLAKSLRPLPEKWHGLKDVELKYRKRYLDLIANPEAAETFAMRSRIVSGVRRFLDGRGFMEVETPIMQPIPGGAAGRPFQTHHQALGMDLYLRVAPELYLKRLLVGGFDKVYELGRSFRNEGLSTRHNPEFTMLEVYEAYGSCASMMTLTEEMIAALTQELKGTLQIQWGDKSLDLTPPWKRVSFAELAQKKCGIKPEDSLEEMAEKLKAKGHLKGEAVEKIPKNQLVNLIMDWVDEVTCQNEKSPVFVTEFFAPFSPLAKSLPKHPEIADRFELFIGGLEVANAYSEQNDPLEQRHRFESSQGLGSEQSQRIDEDFLEALEYGMPPAGGLGIGVDRLTMLLTQQTSIRDAILFPTLRPDTT